MSLLYKLEPSSLYLQIKIKKIRPYIRTLQSLYFIFTYFREFRKWKSTSLWFVNTRNNNIIRRDLIFQSSSRRGGRVSTSLRRELINFTWSGKEFTILFIFSYIRQDLQTHPLSTFYLLHKRHIRMTRNDTYCLTYLLDVPLKPLKGLHNSIILVRSIDWPSIIKSFNLNDKYQFSI